GRGRRPCRRRSARYLSPAGDVSPVSDWSTAAQADARRQLSALVSAGLTVLGFLAFLWLVTQAGSGRKPPTGIDALRWWLSWGAQGAPWLLWALLLLGAFVLVRYGVLEAVRWVWLIPRMARERT